MSCACWRWCGAPRPLPMSLQRQSRSQRRSESSLSRLACATALLETGCWSHTSAKGRVCFLEGATPKQVDDVLESFGMAMGIHAMADLAGSMWAPACVRNGVVKSRMTRPTRLCRTGCLSWAGWVRKPGVEAMSTRDGHGLKTLR